jgi:hypothetical protein
MQVLTINNNNRLSVGERILTEVAKNAASLNFFRYENKR